MNGRSLALAALLSAVVPVPAFSAAPYQDSKAEGEPRYDPATVINITGAVTSVREEPPSHPLSGLHLVIKTDAGEIDTYLGPLDFLKEFEISFSPGNVIQVIGSRVPFGGGRVLLAREVRKGETYLYLRDRSGLPNWPARRNPAT